MGMLFLFLRKIDHAEILLRLKQKFEKIYSDDISYP